MATKTSEELRAELTMTIYGIDPATLLVSAVTVTRGGTLTLLRNGGGTSSYRIKGGKPPRSEVVRVFGLTDVVVVEPGQSDEHGANHPRLSELERLAANQRRIRDAEEATDERRE